MSLETTAFKPKWLLSTKTHSLLQPAHLHNFHFPPSRSFPHPPTNTLTLHWIHCQSGQVVLLYTSPPTYLIPSNDFKCPPKKLSFILLSSLNLYIELHPRHFYLDILQDRPYIQWIFNSTYPSQNSTITRYSKQKSGNQVDYLIFASYTYSIIHETQQFS